MNKAFILDMNLLKEQNLSVDEFNTLLKIDNSEIEYYINNDILNSLQNKHFIKVIEEDNEKFTIIREKGKLLLEFVTIDNIGSISKSKNIKRSSRSIENDLDDFITEYRNLWKGLKPGSLGSLVSCRDKMYRWMQENPTYSKEDILRAAKIYIESLDNYTYLQQADYFIYKKDGREESSRLSAFIDEVPVNNYSFTNKLR